MFLQHPGSEESIWRDEPPAQRMQALRDAANLRNFALRVDDVAAVLDQLARWSAGGGHALPGEDGRRNPNHHRAILALSTAFWDAHLRGDAAARAWLDGDGPASVLEAGDRWQRK